MDVNFEVLSGITVSNDYVWDFGTPLSKKKYKKIAYSTTNYISGYAPALKVKFKNTSQPSVDYDNETYEWNFGDYYSTTLKETLTSKDYVEHLYTMPGVYTVSLNLNQTKQTTITRYLSGIEIKNQIVELKEVPPVAKIFCVTQPVYGYSPLTVRLSPQYCLQGSFPIDRIDWDFNDGSDIKTITRYSLLTGEEFIIHTNKFPQDPLDVRNYDVVHTFVRGKDDYPVFYPSLTCYVASTNTSDSCATTIGPLMLSAQPQTINLIKARNTSNGNLYVFDVNQKAVFFTTHFNLSSTMPECAYENFNTSNDEYIATFENDYFTTQRCVVSSYIPKNRLRNGAGIENTGFTGNSGTNVLYS